MRECPFNSACSTCLLFMAAPFPVSMPRGTRALPQNLWRAWSWRYVVRHSRMNFPTFLGPQLRRNQAPRTAGQISKVAVSVAIDRH